MGQEAANKRRKKGRLIPMFSKMVQRVEPIQYLALLFHVYTFAHSTLSSFTLTGHNISRKEGYFLAFTNMPGRKA